MNVSVLTVGEFQANCYVVWRRPPECVLIDPGAEAETILSWLRERNLTAAAYLLTHGHVDHISAVADLYDAMPAPVAMHAADLAWAFSPSNQMLPFFPAPRRPASGERPFGDAEDLAAAGLTFRVIATPGHTSGSVCFLVRGQDALFTGDTLFAGSVGRTDLPGGDGRRLSQSLKALSALADTLTVYPGHGPVTDLATEKSENYFLRS
jgi:glyoxylase-like metal-dependent hydrolase (beta-lactamase superfamily II)